MSAARKISLSEHRWSIVTANLLDVVIFTKDLQKTQKIRAL